MRVTIADAQALTREQQSACGRPCRPASAGSETARGACRPGRQHQAGKSPRPAGFPRASVRRRACQLFIGIAGAALITFNDLKNAGLNKAAENGLPIRVMLLEEEMPFNEGDDVYTLTARSTGEVKKAADRPVYDVSYDVIPGTGQHHEDDLRNLPFKGRTYFESFFIIVDAKKERTGRKLDIKYRRNDGRRL